MSAFETRRRVLAILAAALGTPISGKAFSLQVKGLPSCSTDRVFGAWKTTASTFGGSFIEYRLLPVEADSTIGSCTLTTGVLPNGEKHYGITLFLPKSDAPFDISVISQTGTRKQRVGGKWTLNNQGLFYVSLSADSIFAEPNPLLNGSVIDFLVAQKGRQLAHFRIDSAGFASAAGFIAQETGRLRIAKDQHKCEEPCFMTTACCGEIGLADNCFELTAMRRFRDEGLARMPGGGSEIARYYEVAPEILAEMRRLGESGRLIPFYVTHILPSAILAQFRFYRLTRCLYNDLMHRLERRYLPE
jgi:hypothetical protein